MLMERIRHYLCDDTIMLGVIMLNCILMFVGGFWPGSSWFELIDAFFTLVFVLEAWTKISAGGWNAYWADGWNRFDFIVLVIALPSLASPLVEHSIATSSVLALRSMRLFKSFKILRFIPNIRRLLNGVKRAFRASLLVLLAFVVLLFIVSIMSSAIFGSLAPEYFGNPAISLYSIFRLFSVEGWYELPDAIAHNGGASWGTFARIYFSMLVFLGGILGMSLINSVFVDAMVEDNNDGVLEKLDHIEKELQELKNTGNTK